jgi:lipoate-protein ligase A
LGRPVLRFYGWNVPAASFGYFQSYFDMERVTALRPLVRRPTAGGLVPHDADWTYSLVFPAGHSWHGMKALESYHDVHEWLKHAFAQVDIETELAPCCRKTSPGQCFAGYEKFDLLWRGKKIAGAAQRRTRGGLLIQGSVQPPSVSLERARWQQAVRETVPALVAAEIELSEPEPELQRRAAELAREKYGRDEFTRKR